MQVQTTWGRSSILLSVLSAVAVGKPADAARIIGRPVAITLLTLLLTVLPALAQQPRPPVGTVRVPETATEITPPEKVPPVSAAKNSAVSAAESPTAVEEPPDQVIPIPMASVMGGVEWALDAPWRLEPPYTTLPINFAIHDVANPKDGTVPVVERFCDMFVAVARPDGQPLPPQLMTGGKPWLRYVPLESFHEIERSAKWPASSDRPTFHTMRRLWNGEPLSEEDAVIADTAEWYATALVDLSRFPAGEYVVTAVANLSRSSSLSCPDWSGRDELASSSESPVRIDCRGLDIIGPRGDRGDPWNLRDPQGADFIGRVGSFLPSNTCVQLANTFRVQLAAQPLPRFDEGWVYGDLHYHSQGTDNEGESAYNYRAVIQAMRALGLDFIVASDHASSSDQVTDIDTIFVDELPDELPIPDWEWLKDWLLSYLRAKEFPVETSIDAARDMNPRRWRHLHEWINGVGGVNSEVLSSGVTAVDTGYVSPIQAARLADVAVDGSVEPLGSVDATQPIYGPRTPQIFLGGEVDAIPEISLEEGENGTFAYGNQRTYRWAAACWEMPSELLDLVELTTFDLCASPSDLLDLASDQAGYGLRDIQGFGSRSFFARQHFIHIPVDPTRDDAFVASETTRYGGAHRRLADMLAEDYEEKGKGYLFLAHPVNAASGSGFSRIGPDIVPYSERQLMAAFRSQYFLGLQLWNEDSRLLTKPGTGGFPMECAALTGCGRSTHPRKLSPWSSWGVKDESSQLSALHHGAAMWDRMLLWGLNPARTEGISWLPAGAPRRVYIAGGSDAHGDLNFRREGSITGWLASTDTAIGKPRNLLYVGKDRPQAVDGGRTIGQTQVVDALRTGQFSVTDGPALRIAIDRNGNGTIDSSDTPMGGFVDLTSSSSMVRDSSIPVLVEWKSTPEFGPVTSIDLYVGSQAGTEDGVVWAPSDHGARGSDSPSGTITVDLLDEATGKLYKQLKDGYFLAPNAKLRIAVSSLEAMSGVHKVVLSPFDYPIVDRDCRTETVTNDPVCWTDHRGNEHCTKPTLGTRDVCSVTRVTTLERMFVRAFARTASAAPVGSTTVPLQRFAYTNPVWIRPALSAIDLQIRTTDLVVPSAGPAPVDPPAKLGPPCVYRGAPPVAVSKRRARIRILSQNTFGLDRDGNSNCEARATRIGSIIATASPAYDIVALQEHWNSLDAGKFDCGGDQLDDAIWSTGRYRNSNNYYRQRPEGEWYQGETDGGQSIFTLHPIKSFDENEWDDIPGVFDQLQGSTFSRIKLNGTEIHIDFYNVHLLAGVDECDVACRRKQLQELRNEIILHSKASGNPVIVVGDFNIGGPPACTGNDGYADIMQVLENPRDLWLEAHPYLNGFTMDCQRNTVLRDVEACTYRERIDFMFLVESSNLTSSAFSVVLRDANDMRLAEFTRSNGKHVSDHFGIEATLDIRERGRMNTPFIGLAQKCMDVSGGQAADGTPVQIDTCTGSATQHWTLGHDGQLRGIGGKCLTVRNGSTANRTVTELGTCAGSAAQRFDYTALGELRSHLDPNKCVEVRGGSTDSGTPVQIYDCNGTASQRWQDR